MVGNASWSVSTKENDGYLENDGPVQKEWSVWPVSQHKKHGMCQVGAPHSGSVFELCCSWPRPRLCSYNFRFWFCSSHLISMQNHHHKSKSQLTWNRQLHRWRFNRFPLASRWILSSDESKLMIFCNTFVYVYDQRLEIKTSWCDER